MYEPWKWHSTGPLCNKLRVWSKCISGTCFDSTLSVCCGNLFDVLPKCECFEFYVRWMFWQCVRCLIWTFEACTSRVRRRCARWAWKCLWRQCYRMFVEALPPNVYMFNVYVCIRWTLQILFYAFYDLLWIHQRFSMKRMKL